MFYAISAPFDLWPLATFENQFMFHSSVSSGGWEEACFDVCFQNMSPLPMLDTFGNISSPRYGGRKYVAFVLPELVSVKAYESNGKLEGINNKIGAVQRLYDFS
jgi:hypothetical protein